MQAPKKEKETVDKTYGIDESLTSWLKEGFWSLASSWNPPEWRCMVWRRVIHTYNSLRLVRWVTEGTYLFYRNPLAYVLLWKAGPPCEYHWWLSVGFRLELQDSAGCIMYIFMSPIFRYYKRFSQSYVRTVSRWPRLDTGCIIKIERRIFCNSPLIALSKKKIHFDPRCLINSWLPKLLLFVKFVKWRGIRNFLFVLGPIAEWKRLEWGGMLEKTIHLERPR